MFCNEIAVRRQPDYRGHGLFVWLSSVTSKMAQCLPQLYLHWLLHTCALLHSSWLHRIKTKGERARSDTKILSYYIIYRHIQLGGNNGAELVHSFFAFFSEKAVGVSHTPWGWRRCRGACVCVTSHLLLNPISKAWGLNQPSPLKACQGKAHK